MRELPSGNGSSSLDVLLGFMPEERREPPARTVKMVKRRGAWRPHMPSVPGGRRGKRIAAAAVALGAANFALHVPAIADRAPIPGCESRSVEWGGVMSALPKGCLDSSDPLPSRAVWPVASEAPQASTTEGTASTIAPANVQRLTEVVNYRIEDLAVSPTSPDIGVVVSVEPDEQRLGQLTGLLPGTEELQGQMEQLRADPSAYTNEVRDILGTVACVADMNMVIDRAQAIGRVLVDETNLSVDALRGAESLYNMANHGGQGENDPEIPNIYVVYETESGGMAQITCATPQ